MSPSSVGPNCGVSFAGDGNRLALTIDGGTDTAVVAAFGQFYRDSGVRLTFFADGVNNSWTANAPLLRPMVDSGQIQMANHTRSHPRVTSLPLSAVSSQQLVRFAESNFQPQQIVLGHANLPPITGTYSQLLDIISQRGLQTVTLADVFI